VVAESTEKIKEETASPAEAAQTETETEGKDIKTVSC
jgi:hypothetical protein